MPEPSELSARRPLKAAGWLEISPEPFDRVKRIATAPPPPPIPRSPSKHVNQHRQHHLAPLNTHSSASFLRLKQLYRIVAAGNQIIPALWTAPTPHLVHAIQHLKAIRHDAKRHIAVQREKVARSRVVVCYIAAQSSQSFSRPHPCKRIAQQFKRAAFAPCIKEWRCIRSRL